MMRTAEKESPLTFDRILEIASDLGKAGGVEAAEASQKLVCRLVDLRGAHKRKQVEEIIEHADRALELAARLFSAVEDTGNAGQALLRIYLTIYHIRQVSIQPSDPRWEHAVELAEPKTELAIFS